MEARGALYTWSAGDTLKKKRHRQKCSHQLYSDIFHKGIFSCGVSQRVRKKVILTAGPGGPGGPSTSIP